MIDCEEVVRLLDGQSCKNCSNVVRGIESDYSISYSCKKNWSIPKEIWCRDWKK